MTRNEAKLLLSVHRRFDPDPDDPDIAIALEMVAQDPELRAWYEKEQDAIAALDAKMAEVRAPAELRARVLSGGTEAAVGNRRRFVRFALATAAVLLVGLGGSLLWLTRPYKSGGSTLAAYEQDMGAFLDRLFLFDYENDKVGTLAGWLKSKRGLEEFLVPGGLAAHPALGCEVIPWNGRLSYLICFDVDGEIYHLFLLPGGADLTSPADDRSKFPADPKWAAATWKKGNDLYYLCALAEEDEFQRVIEDVSRL